MSLSKPAVRGTIWHRVPRWHRVPELQRLFYYHTGGYSTNRQQHLEFVGQLLRRTLVRRDYCRAYKIYNNLVTNAPMSEEFMWKVKKEPRFQSGIWFRRLWTKADRTNMFLLYM